MKLKSILGIVSQSLKGEYYDYTQGSIRKAIVLLAIPMILELSLESVFAIVDIFFVGKLGTNAIATVGFTESLITIIYSVAIGLSTAATAIIARRVGEKDYEAASISAFNAIALSIIFALVLGGIGVFFAEDLLRFMGADDNVISQGIGYTRIMFGTNVVIVLLFLINGIFRGAGNAALAMESLWIASIINIVLDPIMIYGLGSWNGFGLEGAAIATVIGRSCGVAYQLYALIYTSNIIKIGPQQRKWINSIIKKIVDVAWPATVQFIIASGSWIVMTRLIANEGGIDAAAGYQVAIRNIIFFILPAWGLSNAAATLVGQNLGAQQPERAERSVILTTWYNIGFMAVVSLLFLVFARPIILFFTDVPAAIDIGVLTLNIIGAGYIFYGIGMVMMQSINGAGDTKTPTIINFVCFWILQIPLAYFCATYLDWGVTGVLIAVPIAEACIAIAAYWYFRQGKWKKVEV